MLAMHVLHVNGEHSDRVTRHCPVLQEVLQPVVQEVSGGGEAAARRALLVVAEADRTTVPGGGGTEIVMSLAGGNCPIAPASIARPFVMNALCTVISTDSDSLLTVSTIIA